jgi:hypothetical protein
MNKSDETSWARWKKRVKRVIRRHPGAVFAFAVIYSYLADCLIAHKSHPDVSWLLSGVHCGGPFGFVATVGIVVVGVCYCLKKGY